MKEDEGEDKYFLSKEELTSDTSLCLDTPWPSSWHIRNSREKEALLSCVYLLGFISLPKFVMNLLMEGHTFLRLNKNLLR